MTTVLVLWRPLPSQYWLPNWTIRQDKEKGESLSLPTFPEYHQVVPLVEKIEHYHHQKNRICLWNSLNTLNKKNEEVIISHVVSSWVLIDDRLPEVEEGCESSAAATHKAFLCDDNMSGLKIIWVDYFLSFSFLSSDPIESDPCLASTVTGWWRYWLTQYLLMLLMLITLKMLLREVKATPGILL